jgi:hypothetical protein
MLKVKNIRKKSTHWIARGKEAILLHKKLQHNLLDRTGRSTVLIRQEMIPSCFNCQHWQNIFPDIERAKRIILWEGVEPNWYEKGCKIPEVEKLWLNRKVIGELVNKYQSGSADEVKEAIAAQCPKYKKLVQ